MGQVKPLGGRVWVALLLLPIRVAAGEPEGEAQDFDLWLAKLKDPSGLVRQDAATALAAIRPVSEKVVLALAGALRDPEWEVQSCVAMNLGAMGTVARAAEPELARLLAIYTNDASVVRGDVLTALVQIRRAPFVDPEWIERLKPEAKPVARLLFAIRSNDVALLQRLYAAELTVQCDKSGWAELMADYREPMLTHRLGTVPFGELGFVAKARGSSPDKMTVSVIIDGKEMKAFRTIREAGEWFLDER